MADDPKRPQAPPPQPKAPATPPPPPFAPDLDLITDMERGTKHDLSKRTRAKRA